MAMEKEGTSKEDAWRKIFLKDSRGLVVEGRTSGGISEHKRPYAQNVEPMEDLQTIVETIKPSVLIGAAAIGGAFTEGVLSAMARFNARPIIFALSNPTSKAECTAEQAYRSTNGKAIFASGSPFPPVKLGGKTHYPGQGNNAYIFPGLAAGVVAAGIKRIQEEAFLVAAQVKIFLWKNLSV